MIVRLSGGLGNQMFQYAMGRVVSELRGEELYIDTYGFKRDPLRNYALGGYSLKAKLLKGPAKVWYNALFYLNRKLRFIPKGKNTFGIYFEKEWFIYEDLVNNKAKFFEGCWQNTRYFEKRMKEIREELCGDTMLPAGLSFLKEELKAGNSVSLHVRHGDYLNSHNQTIYKIPSLQYYENAMHYLEEQLPETRFYIFSDDIAWCKKQFASHKNCVIIQERMQELVETEKISDGSELYLMQCCRHHIIANSSFSYWGAMLGEQEGSIKISPRTWFVEEEANDIVADSLLKDFIILESDGDSTALWM